MPVESDATAEFADGATVRIETVLVQSNSTIVQLDSRLVGDDWIPGRPVAFVETRDPGWRRSFTQSNNLQFLWEGAGAPDQLDLVQAYPRWQRVAAETLVVGGDS